MSQMPRELSPWKVVIRATSRKLAGFTRARRPILFPTYDEQVRRRIEQRIIVVHEKVPTPYEPRIEETKYFERRPIRIHIQHARGQNCDSPIQWLSPGNTQAEIEERENYPKDCQPPQQKYL